eukprot:768623-Hanusia_phi.AAC.2
MNDTAISMFQSDISNSTKGWVRFRHTSFSFIPTSTSRDPLRQQTIDGRECAYIRVSLSIPNMSLTHSSSTSKSSTLSGKKHAQLKQNQEQAKGNKLQREMESKKQ